jgi:hypothetical protein
MRRRLRRPVMESAMRAPILAVTVLALMSTDALAISRYTATSMSCPQVKATIADEGAVILRYRSKRNPSVPLYGRYVYSGAFCSSGEIAETTYIPTSDTASCPVRECHPYSLDDDPRNLFLND